MDPAVLPPAPAPEPETIATSNLPLLRLCWLYSHAQCVPTRMHGQGRLSLAKESDVWYHEDVAACRPQGVDLSSILLRQPAGRLVVAYEGRSRSRGAKQGQ